MKAYYRISTATAEQQMKIVEKAGNFAKNKYFTLTAIDFGDGLINLKNEAEFDKNEARIMKFFKNENQKIILPKLEELNTMEHCDDDNIVRVDTDEPSIHIGYADEFFK